MSGNPHCENFHRWQPETEQFVSQSFVADDTFIAIFDKGKSLKKKINFQGKYFSPGTGKRQKNSCRWAAGRYQGQRMLP